MSDKSRNKGVLYLIPCPIADESEDTIPNYVGEKLISLSTFICERIRTTRRFIKKIDRSYDIDGAHFIEMDKGGKNDGAIKEVIHLLESGKDVGLLSEAGCPCVADPGYKFVLAAHSHSILIKPMVGPSSILLALMASGLDGQLFTFHGYLPVKEPLLIKKIKHIGLSKGTDIFIETPYRNKRIFRMLTTQLPPNVKLCIASDVTGTNESILTKTIQDWKKHKEVLFEEKIPTIFLVG